MRRLWIGAVVIAAGGFIALSYELLWYRLASFAASSTLATFPLLLGCYLVGIALGSLGAERVVASGRSVLRATRIALLVGNVIGALVGATFADLLTLGVPYYAALAMFGVGAVALGFLFPLLTHWAVPPDSDVGSRVSWLYAANIVGSVAGSALTGFVLFDVFTLMELTVLLATAGFLLYFVVGLTDEEVARGRLAAITVAAVAGVWLVVPPAYEGIWDELFYWDQVDEKPAFAEIYEGRGGVVAITPDGRALSGGVYDGTFSVDLVHDKNGIFRAYAGPIVHPAPKRILCIGLATGSWAAVLANAPGVEELVIVEIESLWPRVIASREPQSMLLDDPRVTWVIDDGRRWLNANPDEKFDLVVANVTYNWRSHSSMVLSAEFQKLVAEHLAPGGMLMINTTDAPAAWSTVLHSFPHVTRVYNAAIASNVPIGIEPDRWRDRFETWKIYGEPVFDLSAPAERAELDRLVDVAERAKAGEVGPDSAIELRATLDERFGDAPMITDDNMGNEWNWTVVPRSFWLGAEDVAKKNRWEK